MSKIDTNVLHDGQLAVATVDQSGTITKKSAINTNILVQTEDGEQLCVATYPLNGGGGGGYVLPPATASTLGGIKVGANLTVESDGTLNATGGGGSGADTSLSNLTDAGQIKAVHLAMPSSTYDELTIPAVDGTNITTPADGYLVLAGLVYGTNSVLSLTNTTTGLQNVSNPSFTSALFYGITIPVSKGDTVRVGFYNVLFNDGQNPGYLRFVYANGTTSEQGA